MFLSLVHLPCPYLRAVWLRKKARGFSCRSVLGILLLRLQVAIFDLEPRERASTLPLRENTYDFAAGAGAAAGMHFAHSFGRSHGNALRAPLLHLKVAIL